jgi:hypothetical protein
MTILIPAVNVFPVNHMQRILWTLWLRGGGSFVAIFAPKGRPKTICTRCFPRRPKRLGHKKMWEIVNKGIIVHSPHHVGLSPRRLKGTSMETNV